MSDDEIWKQYNKSTKPIKSKDKIKSSDIKKTIYFDTHNSKDYSSNIDLHSGEQKYKKDGYIQQGDMVNVSKATAKLMKSGKFSADARLDMHGMTQNDAFEALYEFISRCYDTNKRNLLIITGKGKEGKGILFDATPRWLNLEGIRENILIFDYASAQDGGKGALYILLKKKK